MSFWERLKSPFAKTREPAPAAGPPAVDTPAAGQNPAAQARLAALTQREREVFGLLVEGYTLRETAQQLGLKYSTVNTHMTGIYRKLGVNSRAELIIRYRDYKKEDSE
jgi:DNA-binding CsgD family transcriptional regulator